MELLMLKLIMGELKKKKEIGVVTSEKKRKEISSKEKAKTEGKEEKETRNISQGSKDKNKEKKGKRRMMETKDGLEIHEVGKREESDEEIGKKTGDNDGLRRSLGFFEVLSEDDE